MEDTLTHKIIRAHLWGGAMRAGASVAKGFPIPAQVSGYGRAFFYPTCSCEPSLLTS